MVSLKYFAPLPNLPATNWFGRWNLVVTNSGNWGKWFNTKPTQRQIRQFKKLAYRAGRGNTL